MQIRKPIISMVLIMAGAAAAAAVGDPDETVSQYITISDMARGISEYNLPQARSLSGTSLAVHFADGADGFAIEYRFVDDRVLHWQVVKGPDDGAAGYSAYMATNPRNGYYYVEYIAGSNQAKMVAVVLDTKRQIATGAFGQFPREGDDRLSLYQRASKKMPLTAARVRILNARIGAPMDRHTPRHDVDSKDLVGKRRLYRYSVNDAYEHIYHDNNNFTWHCVSGNEKGLADTDFAQVVKFEDNFYMIVWVEKVMHVVSAITLDFDAMHSSGAMASFAGWDYGEVVNVPAGAIIRELPGVTAKDLALPMPR
jgi:hypothetical protein